MNGFVLSEAAKNDLEEIYDFGIYKFGRSQAVTYLMGLQVRFEALTKNLNIGKQRNEITAGQFSLPYVSHDIFAELYPTVSVWPGFCTVEAIFPSI